MATRESTKTTTEEGPAPKVFYGNAEHPNNGIFSSLLKRKGRKLSMTDDCKAACKQVEAYKTSADKLHQALMYMLVEDREHSKQLVNQVRTEPGYRYEAQFLRGFDALQKKGRKGVYENLEPAIKACEQMDAEREKYVRRQLESLKALNKFIGEDYWEYVRLRKAYWDALEAYDDAVTLQNKERTEQSERATMTAQTWRNECRMKMMEFIKKAINEQKGQHVESVLKFRTEVAAHHKTMAEMIHVDVKEEKSGMKAPNTK
ncbi:unnamed protein product [Caenorhabditis sp. 36 PRJEB53466]|nr:unnamed protein product [Caenorhabditis sp. 36 PRJEB53466]